MSDQFDLFGARPPDVIGPVVPDAALLDLAARLPPALRMGTASWSYPGWHGLVFDGAASESRLAREGLSAYSRHPLLRTVSLDRAFYQPLTVADYERYAAQTPPDFRFTVKAWRAVTDPEVEGAPNPNFLDPEFARDKVVRPMVRGLGDRTGVLLLQFPPGLIRRSWLPRPELLDKVAALLEAITSHVKVAVEIRTPALLADDWFAVLRAHGAVHAPNVHPSMPPMAEQAARMPAGEFLFLRWMLSSGDRYEDASARYEPYNRIQAPDDATRAVAASLCREALAAGRDVWVIADNKAEGSSPLTLIELAKAI